MLADAVVNIKQVLDTLAFGKFTNDFLVVGDFLRVGGSLKVKGVSNLIWVPYFSIHSHFLFKLKNAICSSKVSGGG